MPTALLVTADLGGNIPPFIGVGRALLRRGWTVHLLGDGSLVAVAGREGLFGVPVEVPAQASPGDRLVGYLGRHPRAVP